MEQKNLTKREIEIIQLLVKGFSNEEISEYLKISTQTVKTHIRNIYAKTGFKDKLKLVVHFLNSNHNFIQNENHKKI